MAISPTENAVLLIIQILIIFSVLGTFLLVVKLSTIKMKTRVAMIGVTANAVLIGIYYLLRFIFR